MRHLVITIKIQSHFYNRHNMMIAVPGDQTPQSTSGCDIPRSLHSSLPRLVLYCEHPNCGNYFRDGVLANAKRYYSAYGHPKVCTLKLGGKTKSISIGSESVIQFFYLFLSHSSHISLLPEERVARDRLIRQLRCFNLFCCLFCFRASHSTISFTNLHYIPSCVLTDNFILYMMQFSLTCLFILSSFLFYYLSFSSIYVQPLQFFKI